MILWQAYAGVFVCVHACVCATVRVCVCACGHVGVCVFCNVVFMNINRLYCA